MAYTRRLARVLSPIDTTRFWVGVAIVSIVLVAAYAYASNRAQVARNQRLLNAHTRIVREQRQALTYLCHTVHLLDASYVQQAIVARLAIRDSSIGSAERNRWRERLVIYNLIHEELSHTAACRRIE